MIGCWKNGILEGKAIQILGNGKRYEGGWTNGIKTGYGVYEYGDGRIY